MLSPGGAAWLVVEGALNELFDSAESMVTDQRPAFSAARSFGGPYGPVNFEGHLTWMYDRRNQRHEDGILSATIANAAYWKDRDGQRRFATEPTDLVLVIVLERGDGLAFMEPIVTILTSPIDDAVLGLDVAAAVESARSPVLGALPHLVAAMAEPFDKDD